MIEASKDITLNEMVLRLEGDRSVSIGRSTLDVCYASAASHSKKTAHVSDWPIGRSMPRRLI